MEMHDMGSYRNKRHTHTVYTLHLLHALFVLEWNMIAIENTDREENIAGKMTSDFSDEGLVSWRACAQAVGYIPPVIRIIINNVTNIEGNRWTCLCGMRDEMKECFYYLIPQEGCTYEQHISIENNFTWKTSKLSCFCGVDSWAFSVQNSTTQCNTICSSMGCSRLQ